MSCSIFQEATCWSGGDERVCDIHKRHLPTAGCSATHVTTWENHVTIQVAQTFEEIGEEVRLVIWIKITPKEIHNHLQLNTACLNTYEALNREIDWFDLSIPSVQARDSGKYCFWKITGAAQRHT